jgi:hypothetical protein
MRFFDEIDFIPGEYRAHIPLEDQCLQVIKKGGGEFSEFPIASNVIKRNHLFD